MSAWVCVTLSLSLTHVLEAPPHPPKNIGGVRILNCCRCAGKANRRLIPCTYARRILRFLTVTASSVLLCGCLSGFINRGYHLSPEVLEKSHHGENDAEQLPLTKFGTNKDFGLGGGERKETSDASSLICYS